MIKAPKIPSEPIIDPPEFPEVILNVPKGLVPDYPAIYIPPNDLRPPPGVKSESKKEQPPPPPKLKIPRIDIEVPFPTTEVVMTATYAAVAAVATTTLATPFFDTIKKKVQKFLQKKIDTWKENRKKKRKDSSTN